MFKAESALMLVVPPVQPHVTIAQHDAYGSLIKYVLPSPCYMILTFISDVHCYVEKLHYELV